jgi:hypothetical protein
MTWPLTTQDRYLLLTTFTPKSAPVSARAHEIVDGD